MSVPDEMDFAKALKEPMEIVSSWKAGSFHSEESLAKFEEGIGEGPGVWRASSIGPNERWKRSSRVPRSPVRQRNEASKVTMALTLFGRLLLPGPPAG